MRLLSIMAAVFYKFIDKYEAHLFIIYGSVSMRIAATLAAYGQKLKQQISQLIV